MSLLRREELLDDEPAPLEPREVAAMIEFSPKPTELVAAAALGASEWQRTRTEPKAPALLEVPWSETAPTRPGLYWWLPKSYQPPRVHAEPLVPRLAVVLDREGRLCARGNTLGGQWHWVQTLYWMWSGPVAIPAGLSLEDLARQLGYGNV